MPSPGRQSRRGFFVGRSRRDHPYGEHCMRSVCDAIGAVLVLIAATAALAQQPASTPAPGQTTSPTQAPTAPPPAVGQVTPAQPAAPAQAPQPRTFTAPLGLLFNTVRAD